MTWTARLVAAFVVAFFVAAISAGCGASSPAGSDHEATTEAPDGDFSMLMQRCMSNAGFEIEILEDGGISSQVAPEQIPLRDEALATCADEFGFSDPPPPLTDAQLADLYEDLVGVADCLRDAGYPVDDPVSQEHFVDSRGEAWHPYDAVPIESAADFKALEDRCPQP